GFTIHRWGGGSWITTNEKHIARAKALVSFLREGLKAPPLEPRELTAEERRGKELFAGAAQCATCHAPATGFTDRSVVALAHVAPPAPFADDDPKARFKTPSLLFAGRSAPYFHDGRAATLLELVEDNHDRMGLTSVLSAEDKKALAAYVATI